MLITINVTCNDRYSILSKLLCKNQIDPYLVKNGDLPRISDGFSEISIGSKGLRAGSSRILIPCEMKEKVRT